MNGRSLVSLALLVAGCAPSFEKALTPSGDPCTDMPILSNGQTVEREYHRMGPVKSALKCTTDAERVESLRREACKRGADAVIEATVEEERQSDNSRVQRASGTAVTWRRAPAPSTPLGGTHAPAAAPAPAAPVATPDAPAADAPPE